MKICHLDLVHKEKKLCKQIVIKASDYPDTVHEPKEEVVSILKISGDPCVINKINEIIDYINSPWYKKLFYKIK